ncbi:MAG: orotate phosphoribosyltransferase [Bacteroidota bacterium]|nr:orotate phosphoribosyltransferase [Bacteroidota bacterium]
MIIDSEVAREAATKLLQIKAIKLQPDNPFTWASGWRSPIYCDNRLTLSHIQLRRWLGQQLAEQIVRQFGKPEAIAGVATGAFAIGILVAEALDLPFIYVRPEAKKHGRQNQIEGEIPTGSKVVVIEDLVSTGGSSLKAVQALREAEMVVMGMAALFTYDFKVSSDNFAEAKCELITLSDYPHLIEAAQTMGYVAQDQLETLSEWRQDPSNWKAS